MQVSPLSSGYSLGSSNWIIQSHYEKVSYVSGSSLLTTHPQVSTLLNTFTPLLHFNEAHETKPYTKKVAMCHSHYFLLMECSQLAEQQ